MHTLSASWVARLVHEFDHSGVHRVGTPGDISSGQWLLSEAAKEAADVAKMPVVLDRTIVDEAYLECSQRRIEALPMFDSPATPQCGVVGRFALQGADGEIGYAEFAPNAASIKGQPLEKLRATTRHLALVVSTLSQSGSLAPINAQHFSAPLGPPVLQVAGMHHAFLVEQATAKASIKVLSSLRRERTESFNIQVRALGLAAEKPVVIVTPRTGWWESTAERAGGLVAWLAALGVAGKMHRENRLRRPVLGYATCGHELGHIGLEQLLTQRHDLLQDACYWLHLGANLGAASNPQMMVRAENLDDARRMRDLLIAEGYPAEFVAVEPMAKISGEGHDLAKLGARVLSLAGNNRYFHDASDRWPGNVDAAGIASIARAVARWVEQQAG
jgi:hypothetical protein